MRLVLRAELQQQLQFIAAMSFRHAARPSERSYGDLNAFPETADSVDEWLEQIKLAPLKDAFADLKVADLLTLSNEDLRERVPSMGQRRRAVPGRPTKAQHARDLPQGRPLPYFPLLADAVSLCLFAGDGDPSAKNIAGG